MYKNFRNQSESGQATVVVVFFIGIVTLFLSLGFSDLSVRQAKVTGDTSITKKAYYAAEAGIEDAILRLKYDRTIGDTQVTFNSDNFNIGGPTYSVTVDPPVSPSLEKTITSNGTYNNSVKTIQVRVLDSEQGTGFINAIQTGNGGFELEASTLICRSTNGVNCATGAAGETMIYSNGSVKGAKTDSDCTANDSSKIIGSVTAVQDITDLDAAGDDGPCITKDATAKRLDACKVLGNRISQTIELSDCTTSATGPAPSPIIAPTPLPSEAPFPSFDPDFWKNQSTNPAFGGRIWPTTGTKNCNLGNGVPADDCSLGTGELGPVKINGNFTLNSNTDLTVTGPIWVTGTVTIDSNNTVTLHPDFVNTGTVVLADGKIITNSNVSYVNAAGGSGVIMFATTNSTYPNDCSAANAVINIAGNTNSVIFYARYGCILTKGGGSSPQFYGALVGQKIHLGSNSQFYYNDALSSAVFGVTAGGGWVITAWRDID